MTLSEFNARIERQVNGVPSLQNQWVIAETSDKAAVSLQAGNNVNIKADSSKDIRAYTVGAAGSGVAGVSGAATVVVAKDTTQATVAKQTKISRRIQTPKLTVDAVSDYKLRSASAAVGAAGVAGVAVNAMVTVLRGNTKAELAGEADVKGVDVHAKAKRDVVNAAATVGGAGVAGVGATVLVLSAGAKLSQDAADQLSYGNGQRGKGNKTFDAGKVAGNYKNNSSQSAYAGELDTLEADLQGDGAKDSDIRVGSDKGFDAVGSLRSSDFDNSNYQDSGDTQRGENMKAEETADLRNAKAMGANMSMAEPEDSVVAIIAETAKVTTEGHHRQPPEPEDRHLPRRRDRRLGKGLVQRQRHRQFYLRLRRQRRQYRREGPRRSH